MLDTNLHSTSQENVVNSSESESTNSNFLHKRHLSVAPTIARRGSALSNIWVFDSPKNNKRFTIEGDIAFMHCVLFEGDLTIERYWVNSVADSIPPFSSNSPGKAGALVHYKSGSQVQYKFSRYRKNIDQSAEREIQNGASNAAKKTNEVAQKTLTDLELRSKETLFDNWLLLCAAITRARNFSMYREARILQTRLDVHRTVTLGSLLREAEADSGLMLALIGKSLQQGIIFTELEKTVLSLEAEISRCLV